MKSTHALVGIGAAAVATIGLLVVVPSGAGASPSGTQRFIGFQTDPNAQGLGVIIAKGSPIHAQGTDQRISNSNDKFVFPDGSVRIHHKADGPDVNTFDQVTCYGTVDETGVFTVVRGQGAYKGATGGGTYKLHIDFVGAQTPQGCADQSTPPVVFSLKLNAVGTVTLPQPSTSSSSSAPSSGSTSSAPSTSSSAPSSGSSSSSD